MGKKGKLFWLTQSHDVPIHQVHTTKNLDEKKQYVLILFNNGLFCIFETTKNKEKPLLFENIRWMSETSLYDEKIVKREIEQLNKYYYFKKKTWVNPGDVLVGMVEITDGEEKDVSLIATQKDYGYIEKIKVIEHPITKNKKVIIQLYRMDNIYDNTDEFGRFRTSISGVDIGDKFAARAAQKGVVGLLVDQWELPFDSTTGQVPDVIINPHAIPSRMTMNMLLEMLTNKVSLMSGAFTDTTAFNNPGKIRPIRQMLSDGFISQLEFSGFKSLSNYSMMMDGSGRQIPAYIFSGPCYYQKLGHLATEKMYARRTGPYDIETRQPTDGRSRLGGLRIGEQERGVC